jgi:hypothetical protein
VVVVGTSTDDLDAALALGAFVTDLILASADFGQEDEYDGLARLAPTIGFEKSWGEQTWREHVRVAGKALGLPDKADVPVEYARRYLLVRGAALCAVATAVAGPIAFVALAATQLERRLTRATGSGLVAAGCMGALLVLAADFVAARLSTALLVGVCTAVLGGVYLAWLPRTRRHVTV